MHNKVQYVLFIVLFCFQILIFSNCETEGRIPRLKTSETTNITSTTAISGGSILSNGGEFIIARGVCWSENQNPTILDSVVTNGSGDGSFSSILKGLIPNTSYYVRAFATNINGTGYGKEITFSTTSISDVDGNSYNYVTIGTQVWMLENLRTTKYRNGDPIPNVADSHLWVNINSAAYCNYNNDINNVAIYGRLYNWFAINDSRNIAPEGWHVASDAEWQILVDYLDGNKMAGFKLKESGLSHWKTPNFSNNESGFTALPSGTRDGYYGTYLNIGFYGFWWTSTPYLDLMQWANYRCMINEERNVYRQRIMNTAGHSVRCIRD